MKRKVIFMCAHKETLQEKRAFVAKQFKQTLFSEGQQVQKVNCFCGTYMPLRFAYRCLYCGEFYCLKCAEVHFGKTRAEYLAEKKDKQLIEDAQQ